MAKTLPAITVTDAQYTRVAAVIPGSTAAEKSAAYTTMVRDMLRRLVVDADIRAVEATAAATLEAARTAAAANADNL